MELSNLQRRIEELADCRSVLEAEKEQYRAGQLLADARVNQLEHKLLQSRQQQLILYDTATQPVETTTTEGDLQGAHLPRSTPSNQETRHDVIEFPLQGHQKALEATQPRRVKPTGNRTPI